jgi:glc operon protein GlcG
MTYQTTATSAVAEPSASNPLDVIPDEIPFDVPYGVPISLDRAQAVIQAAVTEAKKRKWKVFEDGIQLMHLDYLLAFDGVIASRGGIPLIDKGAIVG